MKLKHEGMEVDINVNFDDISVCSVIDKVTESVVVVVAAVTAAQIIKTLLK